MFKPFELPAAKNILHILVLGGDGRCDAGSATRRAAMTGKERVFDPEEPVMEDFFLSDCEWKLIGWPYVLNQ